VSYRFFQHRTAPAYRLVLMTGDPFPAATQAEQWLETRLRAEDDVNPSVIEDCRTQGYSLFKLGVTFDEIPV